ncbi:MAG: DUF711 family protein [Candidatus Aminicenantes bacterium]
MKLRTITLGINLNESRMESQVKEAGRFAGDAKRIFEHNGYQVQTLRLATQPWEAYHSSPSQMTSLVRKLSDLTVENGMDYFNIGTVSSPELISLSSDLIGATGNGFCTATAAGRGRIHYRAARRAAAVIKKLSDLEENGFANLRFAVIFNTPPGCPFFPAAYHQGPPAFSIGMENSSLIFQAFNKAGDIEAAGEILQDLLDNAFKDIEKIAFQIEDKEKFRYGGLDVSIAPSVRKEESLALAFEKLGLGKFGGPGTLAAAAEITECLKKTPVKKCGYSGLMLPVLEDYGLALRNTEGTFDIMRLLQYSAVCGTGLDTIPLPGDVTEEALYALLLDIASLSLKLSKPLSARLMPSPGKKAGDMTAYDFEYFVNTRIMSLD